MSGETEREVSGWTTDTLKELHDREIRGDRKLNWVMFGAVGMIVGLGWHEIQRRLIVLNHAHEQHEATLAASVSSDKYESDKKAEDLRVTGIESQLIASAERERSSERAASRAEGARLEQRSDTSGDETARRQVIALVLSGVAILVTVIVFANAYLGRSNGPANPVVVTPPVVTVTTPAKP